MNSTTIDPLALSVQTLLWTHLTTMQFHADMGVMWSLDMHNRLRNIIADLCHCAHLSVRVEVGRGLTAS